MVAITITIQSLEDAANGKPISDTLTEVPRECEKFSVGILEGETQGGQTSIMFICEDGGKAVIGQMTANQFEMLIGAFRGAVARFGK